MPSLCQVRRFSLGLGIAALLLGSLAAAPERSYAGARAQDATAPVQPQSGAQLYHERGCEYCHGVGGVGTDKAPALNDVGSRLKQSRIEQQIADGGGGMPPFSEALTPDEIARLVAYLAGMKKRHALLAAPALVAPGPAGENVR